MSCVYHTSMELFQSPPKKLSTNRCKALHVILNRSDVESFCWALEQFHGSSSDIGAHQDFQVPEFIMPELLPKEL